MITKETIAKINDEADIVDVLSDFITLKKAGSNYKANCPFHNEKTPSFVVSPAKQIYKCFGCGKAGDSVKFVMEHEQFNYVEALKFLAQKYNIPIEETEQSPEFLEKQSFREGLYVANEFAKNYYVEQLFETDEGKSIGLSYCKERGFSESTIKKFQIGYASSQKDSLTQTALEKGYQLDILQEAGLSSKKEGLKLDFFRERVLFPIHGISGKVLGFGGRILKSNTKAPKYINTPDSEIYDKSRILYGIFFAKIAIRKQEECFMVEGYTDVISLNQAGIENVVASGGTSLTKDQVKLVKRYTDNLTILYDGDAAGIKAALRGIDIVLENDVNVKVVLLPDNHDPDSFVQENGVTKTLAFIEEQKKDFILFKLELLLADAENDPVKKSEIIIDIVESISKIPDAIKRSVYLKECAELLKVNEQVLINEANRKRKDFIKRVKKDAQKELERETEQTPIIQSEEIIEAGISIEKYERDVIRTLIEYGELPYHEGVLTIDYILDELESIPIENELHAEFIETARKLTSEEKQKVKSIFTNHTNEEISNLAITLLMGNLNKYDSELSDGWKEKKIFTQTKADIFKDDIETEFFYLKLWRLKLLEEELLSRIEQSNSEEELIKLLSMKKKIDEEKKSLSEFKKTIITPK